jgi:hypothetical protein
MDLKNRYGQILTISNSWCTANHALLSDFFTKYFPAQARVIKADHPNYYFEVDELSMRVKWKPFTHREYTDSFSKLTIVFTRILQGGSDPPNSDYFTRPTPEILEAFLIEYKINKILS